MKTGENGNRPGWFSPIYNRSRAERIDMKTALQKRLVCLTPERPEYSFYKLLKTNLLFLTRKASRNTILVTSAREGEGKTMTSINLALALAREYPLTVMLADCDFYRQDVHKYFGIQSDVGLLNCFTENRSLEDIIIWPGIEKLTFISGGEPVQTSGEVLASPMMKNLVEEMKHRYKDRYILFDGPPILMSTDAIDLSALVDGIVFVAEAGRTTENEIEQAMKLVPREKILGFVLNRQRKSIFKPYGYGYGYGYGYPGKRK